MDMLLFLRTSCRTVGRRSAASLIALLLVGWSGAGHAFWSLGLIPGVYIPQTYYKHGAVYTRAIVLSPAGNPYYVEYDSSGNEGREIAEKTGEYERAQIMAGAYYRSLLQRLADAKERYPEHEEMTAADYRGSTFKTAGGETIQKPSIAPNTLTVLVRAENNRYLKDGSDLLLLELPIKASVQPSASSQSILLSEAGDILHQTANTIAFRVGFYGKDGKVETNNRRDHGSEIYGKMPNVVVTMGGFTPGGIAATDADGKYRMNYFLPACPGFTFFYTTPLYLEPYYSRFNPRGSSMMPYYLVRQDYDFCDGLSAISAWTTLFLPTTVTPAKSILDFPVDLMVVDGAASFANVQLGDKTAYNPETSDYAKTVQDAYDFDGDEKPEIIVPGKKVKKTLDGQEREVFVETAVEEAELQGIYLSSRHSGKPASTEETAPDFTRLIDTTADFKDRGLLQSISKDDLRDTDIYVFRESTGQLVAERRGLHENELYKTFSGVDDKQGSFRFTIQLRGSIESAFNIYAGNKEANFNKWQSAGGFTEEFQKRTANHLKSGEQVRIIAINRPTGYMGSARINLNASLNGNMIDLNQARIQLTPPNLKIWAERKNKIERGMTKGEEKKQLIGNEGAGLGSDISIAIYTDWRDQDGGPLPEALADYGYTGRLAKIVAANQLAPAGANNLSQFKIKPGQQVQVIQLPEKVLAKQHLYLQVAGQPENRNPDFSTGNGTGILKYRPSKYVPVQVPLHDEQASEIARQAYRKADKEHPELNLKKPEPMYAWKYRPEMQFSLYELNVEQIRREYGDGDANDVLNDKSPTISGGDKYLAFVYDLISSELGMLDTWDIKGGERNLLLDLGGAEVKVAVGSDRTVRFENLDSIAGLDESDYLTLRLFSNNDMGNSLWEFAFEQLFMFPEPSSVVPVVELSADDAAVVPYSATYPIAPDTPTAMRWEAISNQPVKFDPPSQMSVSGRFATKAALPTLASSLVQVYAVDLNNAKNKFFSLVYQIVPGSASSVTVSQSGKTAITGFGEVVVEVEVRDKFNNLVKDGTAINIEAQDLDIGGDFETRNGRATITVRGGFSPGNNDLNITVGEVKKTVPIMVHDVSLSIDFPSKIEIGQTVPAKITASSTYGNLQGLVVDVSGIRASLGERLRPLNAESSVIANVYVGNFIGEGRIFATIADKIERKEFEVIDSSPVQLLDRVLVSGVPGKGAFDVEGRRYEYTSQTAVVVSGAPGEMVSASLIDYLDPPLLPELHYSFQERPIEGSLQDDVIGVPAVVKNAERVADRFKELAYAYSLKSDSTVSIAYERMSQIRDIGLVFNLKAHGSGEIIDYRPAGIKVRWSGSSQLEVTRSIDADSQQVITAPVVGDSWHRVGVHLIEGQLILQVDEAVYKSGDTIPSVGLAGSNEVVLGNGIDALVADLSLYDWASEKITTFEGGGLEASTVIDASGKAVIRLSAAPTNLFAGVTLRRLDYWKNRAGASGFLQVAYAAGDDCQPVNPSTLDDFGAVMGAGEAYARFMADCKILPKMKEALVVIRTEKGVWKRGLAIAELGLLTGLYTQTKLVELQMVLGPQCLKGAITGDVENIGSAVCDIITSFFLIGDIRDFALHSKYMYWDNDMQKFDYPVYVFSGLGIAADLASLAGVGIPVNLGLAGAKAGAKTMKGPFMTALAKYLDKEMGGDLTNVDKILPAMKKGLPLLQITAAAILYKDEAAELYKALRGITSEDLVGMMNYARFALAKAGVTSLVWVDEKGYLQQAYALDKDALLKLLGGSEAGGRAIKTLIDSMNKALHTAEGAPVYKNNKDYIARLFSGGLGKFGKNIDELSNDELAKIVSEDKFLTALILATHVGEKAGRSGQDVVDSIRRFHCIPILCGWGNKTTLDFFSLFDKIATKHGDKFASDEAIGSLSEMIRDMGNAGDSAKGLNKARGATEALIQMTKMMDDGWTLVRAEARFLDDPNLPHVHDLVMKMGDKYKYIEVKNWNQSDNGPSLAVYLWSSMKGAAEAKDGKVGQLFVDLKRAFSKDLNDLDVQWTFGNRAGDTAKIVDDLVKQVKGKPERLLVILEEANNIALKNELQRLMRPRNDAEITRFVDRRFKPVLAAIFNSGATLAEVAK